MRTVQALIRDLHGRLWLHADVATAPIGLALNRQPPPVSWLRARLDVRARAQVRLGARDGHGARGLQDGARLGEHVLDGRADGRVVHLARRAQP